MTKEEFITEWIGAPWEDRGTRKDGVDCYGLVHCFMRDVMGVAVSAPISHLNIETGFDTELESGMWREVDSMRFGLVFMSFKGGRATHCGIALDERNVLHCPGSPSNHGSVSVHSLRSIESIFGKCKFYERVI